MPRAERPVVSKLNLLVLHRMGPEEDRREAVVRLENMFAEERPELNIVTHDADLPLPQFVADFAFDAVVLESTFLGARTSVKRLTRVKETYGEVVRNAAFRVALPQDDYDSSAVLDEWMVEWDVDLLYCVIPDRWSELYPQYSSRGRIVPGFTGYLTQGWIDQWNPPKPRDSRRWDVTYRTHNHSALQCDLRHLKFSIADRFVGAVGPETGLRMDISSSSADHIAGARWHEFVEDSRFCLATPSGSSFLDPHGDSRRCVARLQAGDPTATIDDARAVCFPAAIPERPFSAISPRHMEAGLALSVQIATPGDYSGLMLADEHYITLREDCTNVKDVLDQMRDEAHCSAIAHSLKESLLSEPRLRRRAIVDEIVTAAEQAVSARNMSRPSQSDADRLLQRYGEFIHDQGRRSTRKLQVRSQLIRLIDSSAPRLGQRLRGNL